MPNMTLALDAETHRQIRKHPTVNWSEVVRQAIHRRLRELHVWDELLQDSEVTEEEAERVGRDIKASIMRRLGW